MKKHSVNFKRAILCVLLISEVFLSLAQTYPIVHPNRPRIYADSARIAWLQSSITLPGDCKDTYDEFEFRYNNWWINDPQLYLLGNDSTLWTWNWGSGYARDEAVFTVLMYMLNKDALSLKRCRFLAQKTIDTLNNVNYSAMTFYDKEGFIRKFSDVGSLLIDWCNDDLPDTLLHELVRAQFGMNREFMNTFILSASGNSYVSSHNAWNCVFANQNALALYNTDGLTALQHDTVNQWYEAVYDKWINGFLPCYGYYRDDDGGWNWGAAYSMWSLIDQFQFFDNMLIGTGKNFYFDLPWVLNSINQYWYFIQPNDWCIHWGDGQTVLAGDRVTYRHASIFSDPRSIWLAQKYSTPQYYYSTPFVFQKLLFRDFTIPAIVQPAMPLDWWSDKVGLSVSRSSWDSSSTMVTFFNSPSKRAAHEHRDNNSFTVFKNRPLLIDAGYYDTYGGTHYNNYYSRTIAHNTVCVYDSAEQFTVNGVPVSNDGGQIESFALQNYNDIFLPQNQRGNWIKYGSDGSYQYNIADAQLSYDPAKLDFFRRRLLYVKPDRLIVLDHLHINNSATQQREVKWIAHFEKQPGINGNLLSAAIPGHIETYDGNDYTMTFGNGSIAIRTLLPEATNTTLIGGAGYEYFTDGINNPPLIQPDTNKYSPGKWRIEVMPDVITDTIIYLHTISIDDSVSVAVAGGIAKRSGFSTGTDWNDTLFYFSANADTGVVYHVFDSVAGSRNIGIFAADLKNGSYWVRVDGTNILSATTDSSGIIQETLFLTAGYHTVEIVQQSSALEPETGNGEWIQIFPNPAGDEAVLVSSLPGQPIRALITDLTGRIVRTVNTDGHRSLLTLHGLARGTYLVVVESRQMRHVARLVRR